jgi:hypothetical protein
MSLLSPKFDAFRFAFPSNFFTDEVLDKYAIYLKSQKNVLTDPVEFLNSTIKGTSFLGMGNATIKQDQTAIGSNYTDLNRTNQFGQQLTKDTNEFLHTSSEYYYRSEKNPLSLIDKSFKVNFKHTLGFINYFMLMETFFYRYMRDRKEPETRCEFELELISISGSVISKVILMDPVVDALDSLELGYEKIHPESQSFSMGFKYSNIDYQFIY